MLSGPKCSYKDPGAEAGFLRRELGLRTGYLIDRCNHQITSLLRCLDFPTAVAITPRSAGLNKGSLHGSSNLGGD